MIQTLTTTQPGKPEIGQAEEAIAIAGILFSVALWGFAVYGVYSFLKRRKRA